MIKLINARNMEELQTAIDDWITDETPSAVTNCSIAQLLKQAKV